MKDLRMLAIHHLKDWDLIFEFVGKPKQIDSKLSWGLCNRFLFALDTHSAD